MDGLLRVGGVGSIVQLIMLFWECGWRLLKYGVGFVRLYVFVDWFGRGQVGLISHFALIFSH